MTYCIKDGYVHRETPSQRPNKCGDAAWQPDVYRLATLVAKAYGLVRIADIGCGDGVKTCALAGEFQVTGYDLPHLKRLVPPTLAFVEHDLMSDEPLPDLRDHLVIAADVIEHLPDPTRLLSKVMKSDAPVAVVSTPERKMTYGRDHDGPPKNERHCREWAIAEFAQFLEAFEPLLFLTRSTSTPGPESGWATIVAVLNLR
jgi:2-polyprenyl-3-methyl-5-hydroxy-6-metoxy-1,4-benzoquinol methylase